MTDGLTAIRLLRPLITASYVLLIYLSSGSLELFKEGGARPQAADYVSSYSGPLDLVLFGWLFASALLLAVLMLSSKRLFLRPWSGYVPLLLLLAAISIVWSPNKYIAARTTSLMGLSYLVCATFFAINSIEKVVKVTVATMLVMLVSSMAFCIWYPTYGISVGNESGAWQGIFSHKNNLGNFCAFSACIFLGLWTHSKPLKRYIFMGIAISASLAWMSESTTSIAAIVSAGILFLTVRRPKLKSLFVKCGKAYLLLLLTISASLVLIAILGDKASLLNKDTTFSNRNLIWGFVLLKSLDAPILGHGVSQFQALFLGNDTSFLNSTGFLVSHAHNGFIDALFSLGLVGTALIILILKGVLPKSITENSASLRLILLTVFVLINTFEVRLVVFDFGFVALCFAIFLSRYEKEIAGKSPQR